MSGSSGPMQGTMHLRITEDPAMPAIVEFPTVVQDAVAQFGPLFVNEPERRHLAEYLTGLMVAGRKNVSAINREFVDTTDQSCLNRWLTAAAWDAAELNRQRLAWLQQDPSTRYSAQGVIPIDNVLIDHDGKLIEDAGWFWDHAEQRHKIAHDYLIVDYVCTSASTTRWTSAASSSATSARRTSGPSATTTSCSANWWTKSSSSKSPAISPLTAGSRTRKTSITSTATIADTSAT